MTENRDVQFPKTPGKEQSPRDQPAKGCLQPPTPPRKTTFKPAVPKFGNATEIAKDAWITWTGGIANELADLVHLGFIQPVLIQLSTDRSRAHMREL